MRTGWSLAVKETQLECGSIFLLNVPPHWLQFLVRSLPLSRYCTQIGGIARGRQFHLDPPSWNGFKGERALACLSPNLTAPPSSSYTSTLNSTVELSAEPSGGWKAWQGGNMTCCLYLLKHWVYRKYIWKWISMRLYRCIKALPHAPKLRLREFRKKIHNFVKHYLQLRAFVCVWLIHVRIYIFLSYHNYYTP